MIMQRTFTNGYQVFTELGREWHLIDSKTDKAKFEETLEQEFGEGDPNKFSNGCFGFVLDVETKNAEPLYKDEKIFIMSNDGQLFKDLSYK